MNLNFKKLLAAFPLTFDNFNMKNFFKKISFGLVFFLITVFAFSENDSKVFYEFGIGSGFVFYGKDETKDLIKKLDDGNQFLINANLTFLIPLQDFVYFSFGGDSTFDFHWKNGDSIYLIDYSAFFGFRIYPNLAGLCLSVDYDFGRRTDFIEVKDSLSENQSTPCGNGFRAGISYDFSRHTNGIAPVVGANLKHMPRGNSSDNILSVFLNLHI